MYDSDIGDDQLIENFVKGDNKAFDVLLKKYQNRIFSYIIQLVHDHDLANDVFQDVFIKVVTHLKRKSYNHQGKFLSWVLRIAHNQVIDHFRKDAKMPSVGKSATNDDFNIFDVLKLEESSIEDEMVNKQILADVRSLVEQLPKDQMDVVKMRYFSGMSFQDIADKSNVSINTALGRMRYALINLRKMMKEKNIALVV
ncbi:MAG: sigma-70 family RNA polymerase sigma factor [Flavobacteriales bacterium]|nr:sigma-70 family RNA polymerase sigma factor [Flavobacteriales bacterium]